jgi:hypothetical protein
MIAALTTMEVVVKYNNIFSCFFVGVRKSEEVRYALSFSKSVLGFLCPLELACFLQQFEKKIVLFCRVTR